MTESRHLSEFDYFRGLSIFFVVWGHMNIFFGEYVFMDNYAELSKLLTLTVQNGTSFFVFISGFMFFWVYYRRGFQYKAFLCGKFNNLFRPYFCIATIFSLIHVIYGVCTGRIDEWNFWIDSTLKRFLLDTWMYCAFWYMPFIAVVFVLSPIYLKFAELRFNRQIFLLILSLTVSCLLSQNSLNPLHSCAYFSVYYLFGIVCAQNYERIKNISVKLRLRLLNLYLFLILFAAIFGHYNHYITVQLPFVEGITITDFTPIFKLPECLLLLWVLEKIANASETLKKFLHILGKYSFAIFFLHNFLIAIFEEIAFWTDTRLFLQDTAWLYVVGFAMTIVVCKICIFVAAWLKEKIGANSRIYIGV